MAKYKCKVCGYVHEEIRLLTLARYVPLCFRI